MSLADDVVSLQRRVEGLNTLVLGARQQGIWYALAGSHCIFGCKVTQGYSATDLILALEGAASGDGANLNPDRSVTPIYPEEYSNLANIYGELFMLPDQNLTILENTTLTVATAPGTGYHRYDIVYGYVGNSGAAIAIAAGTAVLNASTPTDPEIPHGALSFARVHVEAGVTGIANAKITDLRDFSGRLMGATGVPGIIWTGAWSGSTPYEVSNGVFYEGSAYIAILAGTNHLPSDDTYWEYLNLGVNYEGDWLTTTLYSVGNLVKDAASTQNIYYCAIEHTSGTLAADIAAGKWILWIDNASATASAAAAAVSETNAGISAVNAATAETNAELAETNAETAEANAAVSAGNAGTSETNAGISASNAQTAETNAELAETNAETAETNAETAETNSKATLRAIAFTWNFDNSTVIADPGMGDVLFNHATLASVTGAAISDLSADPGNPDTSATVLSWDDSTNTALRGTLTFRKYSAPTNYATYNITGASTDNVGWTTLVLTYTDGAGSFVAADPLIVQFTSAASAASSATAAATAKTNAELAETNAETAETNAELAETNAAASALAGSISETNAGLSAGTATTQAGNASTSAGNAATSESNAGASASAASGSASAASTAETNAELAETNAETAETNAAASAVSAAASAAKLTGTSTTTLTPSLAEKVVTTQTGKDLNVGSFVTLVSDSVPTVWMYGPVTTYAGSTLTFTPTTIGTATEKSDWTILGRVGARGPDGAPGAGSGDVVGPASATDGDFAQLDGTTGKLIKGGIAFSTDATLAADSDAVIPSQKAIRAYVAAFVQGLSPKGSVLLATAAALPTNTYLAGVITITATGTLTVDGTVTALNDPILVKDEAAQLKHGRYTVTTAGAIGVAAVLTRATDMDIASEFPGAFMFVESGTENFGAGFVCLNSTPPTVGTTAIIFTQFSGAGEITAGNGLTKTGNTLQAVGTAGRIVVNADTIDIGADVAILGANTFTGQQTFKETMDTVYTITDGAAFEIDPVNGNIQVVTLGAARTPAATNFAAGQAVLLGIDDGTAYAITWTTVAVTWVKVGGTATAPTLATSGYTWIMLWKVGSTIYGCEVGKP